ncbi:MAG: GNAT family N-acetyltransferase [Alphaproteobacteria bacterium]|nr:GNAT family N-acetyltransferase [Alphaproteobacteria bacterium]
MLEILQAGPPDAALISAMSARCFAEPWSGELLASLLAQPGIAGHLALLDGGPAGFVLVQEVGGTAEILLVATLPEARRQGIGRRLLEIGLAAARARGAGHCLLEVAEDDGGAVAFYRQAGFLPAGRRRGYYARPGGPVDALVMRRELQAEESQ